MSIKSLFYKSGLMKRVKLKTPVLSVGNLTFGGTGKTPVIQLILEHLIKKNCKVVVVSRNYKATSKICTRVDLAIKNAALIFGDEPCLIAQTFPTVPIFVGPNKWESAVLAEKQIQPDIILIDDGFQHHALERDLDVVLLDATANFSEYRLFPIGKARESKSALKRADVIFLTKINLVSEEKGKHLYSFAQSNAQPDAKIFEIEFNSKLDVNNISEKKILGFAGIGKPVVFKKMLEQLVGQQLVHFIGFSDHYQYKESDIKKIAGLAKEHQAQMLVTTEKDFVKLKEFKIDMPLYSVGLQTKILNASEEFYAILDQTLHSYH